MVSAVRKRKIVALAAVILILGAYKQLHKEKKIRSCWTRKWISRRTKWGCHHALLQELKREDTKSFRNFLRMDQTSFEQLLEKVTPLIERKTTNMREPISY